MLDNRDKQNFKDLSMSKDSTYQEKFSILKSWMPLIVETIKKDLKNSKLAKNYLPSKPSAKLTNEDLVKAYSRAISEDENGEAIGEWVAQHWLLKKPDLYGFFELKLSSINPEFDQIEQIDQQVAKEIINEACENFESSDVYLFSVINAVVFPPETFKDLEKRAKEEKANKEAFETSANEEKSIEKLKVSYEQQIARLTDKYEKKLQGFEKKYLNDTESLKKQLAILQKKLNSQTSCAV